MSGAVSTDIPCEHPYWTATSDGHTGSGWRCTTCGHWQWIAPWVLRPTTATKGGARMTEPFLTKPGWATADIITNLGGPSYRLLTYEDGSVRFEHRCDRGPRGVVICAPALQLGNGHTLTRREDGAATVRASILCSDCGTHGFVTDGRWADA